MEAELTYNGVTVKLTGTPAEIAEAIRGLGAMAHQPVSPIPVPVIDPIVPGILDVQWSFRIPGCICPQPGDADFGQPWMGVCPAHSVRCSSLDAVDHVELHKSPDGYITAAAMHTRPSVWSNWPCTDH